MRLCQSQWRAARADSQYVTHDCQFRDWLLQPQARMSTITILGLETSCDETAASVVRRHADGRGEIMSNVVYSQLKDHAPYGGVVPEIAARAHVQHLDGLIAQAMAESGASFEALDGVAATAGPGLLGGLLVAMMEG